MFHCYLLKPILCCPEKPYAGVAGHPVPDTLLIDLVSPEQQSRFASTKDPAKLPGCSRTSEYEEAREALALASCVIVLLGCVSLSFLVLMRKMSLTQ